MEISIYGGINKTKNEQLLAVKKSGSNTTDTRRLTERKQTDKGPGDLKSSRTVSPWARLLLPLCPGLGSAAFSNLHLPTGTNGKKHPPKIAWRAEFWVR